MNEMMKQIKLCYVAMSIIISGSFFLSCGEDASIESNIIADDYSPAWSPDGSKIAFQSIRDGNWEIYSMDADGSNQINLSNDAGYDGFPSWSPDGSRIIFESYRNDNGEIFVMNADGTEQINLTNK